VSSPQRSAALTKAKNRKPSTSRVRPHPHLRSRKTAQDARHGRLLHRLFLSCFQRPTMRPSGPSNNDRLPPPETPISSRRAPLRRGCALLTARSRSSTSPMRLHRASKAVSAPEILDENHVRSLCPAETRERTAVGRPREIEEQARPKVGELPRRAAGERLHPHVADSRAGSGVGEAAAVRGPPDRTGDDARRDLEAVQRRAGVGSEDSEAPTLLRELENAMRFPSGEKTGAREVRWVNRAGSPPSIGTLYRLWTRSCPYPRW
jgi:hypothetical protein